VSADETGATPPGADPARHARHARRSRVLLLVLTLALLVAVVAAAAVFRWRPVGSSAGKGAAAAGDAGATPGTIDHYTCSMHPSVNQKTPGKCPICGMDLVPVTKEQQAQRIVTIDDSRRQLIGVKTSPVVEAPMRATFQALGRVAYDESSLRDVNLEVRGWITHLLVNETGKRVARGQTLFTMYSPELYAAQQDFLVATRGATATATAASDAGAAARSALGSASRRRLRLLGMTDAQIDEVARRGAPMESTPVASPASGFVIEKNVVEGASVEPGTRLYRIAALDEIWIEADVYEADLARVRAGDPATVTLDYLPGRRFDAKVAYVYPYLDPGTRAGRVRVEVANEGHDLKPGMYARVNLASDLGRKVQVPVAAVVYTGPRRLAFVDLGGGRFEPQEIHVGAEADGMFEVLSGLRPGDVVATSGVFLIAAEARIRAASTDWSGTDAADASDAADAGAPAPARPSSAPAPSGYVCPMHREVRSPTPATCPKCGMELEPQGGTR
jgi:Cu(I)/Ag(I) efflux system membrane fusion protein